VSGTVDTLSLRQPRELVEERVAGMEAERPAGLVHLVTQAIERLRAHAAALGEGLEASDVPVIPLRNHAHLERALGSRGLPAVSSSRAPLPTINLR
jgi:hypothetical protein